MMRPAAAFAAPLAIAAALAVLPALPILSPVFPAAAAQPAPEAPLVAELALTSTGAKIGAVTVAQGPGGAVFTVDLSGLPPGPHGFHIHDKGSCAPGPVNGAVAPAGAAGGHYDPAHTGHHKGPDGDGHAGDLPRLTVDASGKAILRFTVARLKDVKALAGHALIVHAGGDNYDDTPKPLGGGGGRIACGVLK